MTFTATQAVSHGTPILDRESRLPPRVSPGAGLAVLLRLWLGAVVIVSACWLLNRPPTLREWFLTSFRPWSLEQWAGLGIVGVGVSALAAFYLMLAVHELGHVAAGLSGGFRLRSLRIGPLLFNRPFRVA